MRFNAILMIPILCSMVRNRILVGTRFFARPDRPSCPPSLMCNGYRVFPCGKVRPGRAADHSLPSSAAVMEEYSYSSTHPLGHTGPVTGSLYHYPHCALHQRNMRGFRSCNLSVMALIYAKNFSVWPPYVRTEILTAVTMSNDILLVGMISILIKNLTGVLRNLLPPSAVWGTGPRGEKAWHVIGVLRLCHL